ncbi:MAG TPA: hypothetical protein ENG81_04390 [Candidatus Bathyarchaeota archaeon]|nr:hypothetical protein [Candidatus Bathyarchaeota archaeon]
MAVTWRPATEVQPSQKKIATAENYSTIQGLLDLGLIDMPDISNALVRTYGNQDITGFLRATGNFVGGSAEIKEWFEETRLHNKVEGTSTAAAADSTTTITFSVTTASDATIRKFDVIRVQDAAGLQTIGYVLDVATDVSFTVAPYTSWAGIIADGEAVFATVVGNEYAPATNGPEEWIESAVKHRQSPYMTMKEKYKIPGSQMTNIAWVRVPAGKQNSGGWTWYLKGENDQRDRFENYCESAMIEGEVATNSTVTDLNVNGTEGLFSAIQDRGITGDGPVLEMLDIQTLTQELESQRGAAEYTQWCKINQTQDLDDMLAVATGALANTSYGLFDNDKSMAVTLGFSGYRVSGYDFYYKKWKLANDPELLGAHDFNMVMIPSDTIMDARSGEHIPSFSVAYKEAEGYSREIEIFLTGSANLPVATDDNDSRTINYRTERSMCVAAASRYAMV